MGRDARTIGLAYFGTQGAVGRRVSAPPMIMRSAVDRVIRTLALSIGAGALCFTILGAPQIIDQFAVLNPAFAIIAIVVYCGLPPLMAILSFRVSVRTVQMLAYV